MRFNTADLGEGPEAVPTDRRHVSDESLLVRYTLVQRDVERVRGFPLHTVALDQFGDEDLFDILLDVNDMLVDPRELKVGDVIFIPANWQQLVASGKVTGQISGRKR